MNFFEANRHELRLDLLDLKKPLKAIGVGFRQRLKGFFLLPEAVWLKIKLLTYLAKFICKFKFAKELTYNFEQICFNTSTDETSRGVTSSNKSIKMPG